MNTISEVFGEYLKEVRENKRYTLQELAQEIGCTDAYISQIEKGRKKNPPNIHFLKELSAALEEPYSKFLDQAGYDELAAGQKLLEMFGTSSIGLNEKTTAVLSQDVELKERLQVSKELIDSYLAVINKYSLKPGLSNKIIDYLDKLLVMNREYVEATLKATVEWNRLDTIYRHITENNEELRSAYIEMSIKYDKGRLLNFIEEGIKRNV